MKSTLKRKGSKAKGISYKCSYCGGWHWSNAGHPPTTRYERINNIIDKALMRDAEKRSICS